MKRIITDTRLNPMFNHEVGTLIEVLSVDGMLVEYSVDAPMSIDPGWWENGRVFYTRLSNLNNYSKP